MRFLKINDAMSNYASATADRFANSAFWHCKLKRRLVARFVTPTAEEVEENVLRPRRVVRRFSCRTAFQKLRVEFSGNT